jgi:hypothetical protein
MSSNFSSLRARTNTLDRLNEEIKKQQKAQADERFWKLSVDTKTKLGYARIRFLDAPKGEDVPWVRTYNHGFKQGGSWFIDNCPTTIARDCPVCKANQKLWNSGIETDKEIVRQRKRKMSFISNILVLEDATHPENVGKVFLFRYGQKIYDKIEEQVRPKFPDAEPMNPFDLWHGADFKLKSIEVSKFQNYDKSEFADSAPVKYGQGTDEDLEKLWEQEYPLQAFLLPDQYKAYGELEARFLKITVGGSPDAPTTAAEAIEREQPTVAEVQSLASAVDAEAPKARKPRKVAMPPPPPVEVEDEAVPVTGEEEDEDALKKFFASVL